MTQEEKSEKFSINFSDSLFLIIKYKQKNYYSNIMFLISLRDVGDAIPYNIFFSVWDFIDSQKRSASALRFALFICVNQFYKLVGMTGGNVVNTHIDKLNHCVCIVYGPG